MDRREALKNMSLALGSALATSTLLNIVTSCTKENNTSSYLFLNKQQAFIINNLSPIILPNINYDNRKIMDYTRFTDEMLFYTVSPEDKELFNLGSYEFIRTFKKTTNKSISEGNRTDFKNLLQAYFKINEEEEKAVFDLLGKPFSTIRNHEKSVYLNYSFLTKVRYYCLFGYCTSKYFEDSTTF